MEAELTYDGITQDRLQSLKARLRALHSRVLDAQKECDAILAASLPVTDTERSKYERNLQGLADALRDVAGERDEALGRLSKLRSCVLQHVVESW